MGTHDETLDHLANVLLRQHQTLEIFASALRQQREDIYLLRRELSDHHGDTKRDHDDHERAIGEVSSAVRGTKEEIQDQIEDISDQHQRADPEDVPLSQGLSWVRVGAVGRWLLPFLLAGSIGAGARDLLSSVLGEKPTAAAQPTLPPHP
jgi:hypothetical protein